MLLLAIYVVFRGVLILAYIFSAIVLFNFNLDSVICDSLISMILAVFIGLIVVIDFNHTRPNGDVAGYIACGHAAIQMLKLRIRRRHQKHWISKTVPPSATLLKFLV